MCESSGHLIIRGVSGQAGEDAGVDEAGGGVRGAKRRKRAWEQDSGEEDNGPNSEDEAEVGC